MTKLKLRGKGKNAFNALMANKRELNEINDRLIAIAQNLEQIIKNEKNILAGSKSEFAFHSNSKKRCAIEDTPKRLEFSHNGIIFFIDFTVITSEHDHTFDMNGSVIYGTSRTICFYECETDRSQCQRNARCDCLEDKSLIQFIVDRRGIIHYRGELEGDWCTEEDEDLLDLHYRALNLIWNQALEWTNENILPQR